MIIRYGMNNKLNRQGDHRTNIFYYYRVVVGYFEKGNKTTMRGRNDFPVYDGDIRWLCDVANIRMTPAGFQFGLEQFGLASPRRPGEYGSSHIY